MYLILLVLLLVLAAILYILYSSWSVTVSGSYDRIFGGYDSDWIEYYEETRKAVCDRNEFYVVNPNVKLAIESDDMSGVLYEVTSLNDIMVSRAGMVSGTFQKLPSIWTVQFKNNLSQHAVSLKKNGIPDKSRVQFLYELIMSNRGLDPLNKKYDDASTKGVINQHVIAIRHCIDRMRKEIQQEEQKRLEEQRREEQKVEEQIKEEPIQEEQKVEEQIKEEPRREEQNETPEDYAMDLATVMGTSMQGSESDVLKRGQEAAKTVNSDSNQPYAYRNIGQHPEKGNLSRLQDDYKAEFKK